MNEPLFAATGKNHNLIKKQWIVPILTFISSGLNFWVQLDNWRLQRQLFYWLFYEVPPFSYFSLGLAVFLVICTVLLALSTAKMINEAELRIYASHIEGHATKPSSFWPKSRPFDLKFGEIKSVKVRKWGLTVHSIYGRYHLFINYPEFAYYTIGKCIKSPQGSYN